MKIAAKELVRAERSYLGEVNRTKVNVGKALIMNMLYCDRLLDLYSSLKDCDEKAELEYEIDYLIDQARVLKNIQLNESGGTA